MASKPPPGMPPRTCSTDDCPNPVTRRGSWECDECEEKAERHRDHLDRLRDAEMDRRIDERGGK